MVPSAGESDGEAQTADQQATEQTPAEDRGRFRRHPGVWLATLSTVVGLATGMFTLRDQVFPREAGTAGAVSVSTFQRDIGDVCDELNDNDASRARDDKAIKKRLQRAKTTIAQRDVLVDGARRTASHSAHALASFNALAAPTALAAVRRDTETAWNRHLARLRGYALSLDRASTDAQLIAALDHLATLRPVYASDSDTLRSGLARLGEADCDLDPQIVTHTFTLPRLHTHDGHHTPARPANGRTTKTRTTTNPAPTANRSLKPPVNPARTAPTRPTPAAPPANPPGSPISPHPTPRSPPKPPANVPTGPAGPPDG